MKTVTVPELVEVIYAFGLKKRHAQKITLFAVHRKQWVINKQSNLEATGKTLEEVIVTFIQKEKKAVIPTVIPKFTNSNVAELYQLVIENLNTPPVEIGEK